MCKVTKQDCIFQDIMKQYRCQPQAQSHIYRSVLIKKIKDSEEKDDPSSSEDCTEGTGEKNNPLNVTGTSTTFQSEERGDLIKFYNNLYIPNVRSFALKFKSSMQDVSIWV